MEVFVLKFKTVAKLQLPILMAKHRQPTAAPAASASANQPTTASSYPDIGGIKTEDGVAVKQEVKTEAGLNRSFLSSKDEEAKKPR